MLSASEPPFSNPRKSSLELLLFPFGLGAVGFRAGGCFSKALCGLLGSALCCPNAEDGVG